MFYLASMEELRVHSSLSGPGLRGWKFNGKGTRKASTKRLCSNADSLRFCLERRSNGRKKWQGALERLGTIFDNKKALIS